MKYDFERELKQFISGKRYNHTLGVERECRALADIFSLSNADKERLSVAGYLHDITKEKTADEQLELCEKFGIELSDYDRLAPKLFHAKTGAALARELYPDVVDDTVYSCIWWHTTGHPGMTLPEKLVYLADYIEAGRTFEDCVELRKYFYRHIEAGDDRDIVLRDTLIISFDMTMRGLLEDGKLIDENTVATRNFLLYEKLKADR